MLLKRLFRCLVAAVVGFAAADVATAPLADCKPPNYLDSVGSCVAPPSRAQRAPQPAAPQEASTAEQLEKEWGALLHLADRGGWWREANGSFRYYAWDGVGEHFLVKQYDQSGKVNSSEGVRIQGNSLLFDTGQRSALPIRGRYRWDNTILSSDMQRMSATIERGKMNRYEWVRSSKAEFDAAIRAAKAAKGKVPAEATVSASTKAASVPALIYVAPKGAELELQLGREFRITPEMVVQPRQDMFSKYYFVMGVRGRAGERYRISWQGAVPLDHEARDSYETAYPPGQTIFQTSRSITITLKSDGEHALVFSQIGKEYPKETSGGLAGPTMSGGTPRTFQSIMMTVTKL